MTCRRFSLLFIVAGLLTSTSVRAADESLPRDLSDPQIATALVKELDSPERGVRERAQRALGATPYSDIDRVRTLAASQPEGEAKTRLLAGAEAIETRHVINRPPLTLDVTNAYYSDLFAALAKATDVTVAARELASTPQDRFTFHAKNLSYWEVIQRLNHQHPLWPTTPNSDGLLLAAPQPWVDVQFYEGVCIAAEPASKSIVQSTPRDQIQRPAYGVLSLHFQIMIDPRIRIIKAVQAPQITQLLDDHGRDLAAPAPPGPANLAPRDWTPEVLVEMTPAREESLQSVSVTGTITITAAVEEETTRVKNANSITNQRLQVGAEFLTISTLIAPSGRQYPENLEVKMEGEVRPARMMPAHTPIEVSAILNNDRIWTYLLQEPGGVTVKRPKQGTALMVTSATKFKDVKVPFAFKDLPVK